MSILDSDDDVERRKYIISLFSTAYLDYGRCDYGGLYGECDYGECEYGGCEYGE